MSDGFTLLLNLPNERKVTFGTDRHSGSSLLSDGRANGLIIEGSWGVNDLGLLGREVASLLGIEEAALRTLCDDNTGRNDRITLIGICSKNAVSPLKAAVFVPTELGRAYARVATPFFGKPYRDFYYNVVYEALTILKSFSCTRIAIAELSGAPYKMADGGYKDIGNCVAEAIAHYAIENSGLESILIIGHGPDLTQGVAFFNEHPQGIGRHADIPRELRDRDGTLFLTVELPQRQATLARQSALDPGRAEMNTARPDEAGEEHRSPWDWHALPVVELAEMPKGRSLEIEQTSGRKIWLTQLHQYGTDGGRMAGIPQACDRYIESALKMAVTYCGEVEKAPVILTPRLIRLPIHTHPSMQQFLDAGRPQAQLPGITSIGIFYSESIAEEALVSIAVVIWYQDGFGLPTDEYILAQLRELDWPAHAWDWVF